MENRCIYCGSSGDLSKSDIIPDALTNAKIINPYVCKVEHNNKFSDLFEDEVIRKLALITNDLDIKSSKSKYYASYSAQINVDGTDYSTKISSETALFGNKKMRSIDGKSLIGPIDEIRKIKAANDTNVDQIDINQIEVEKKVNIDLSVFFSQAMYRMMAKIAFEWYCVNNEVNDKIDAFELIINYITSGIGEGIVTIVSNIELFDLLKVNMGFGSHTLFSYVGKDNSVNVLVSLFGIAAYNIRLCDSIIKECGKNVLFQELTLDAKRNNFAYDTFDNFAQIVRNSFEEKLIGPILTVMVPKDMTDTTLQYKIMYGSYYSMFQNELKLINEPTQDLISLILKNIESILQESALTIRGLKRFVKEHIKNFDEEVRLNPKGTNKKSIFMFYIMFMVGQAKVGIKSIRDLNKVLKRKFSEETICINDELCQKLKDEILSTAAYSEIIIKGARAIDSWDYE